MDEDTKVYTLAESTQEGAEAAAPSTLVQKTDDLETAVGLIAEGLV